MLESIRNAFKIKSLRNKILFTLGMLVVIRLGSQIPIPGINREYFAEWFSAYSGEAFNFFSAFTGGSFENMSIFALSITPYITASIIIELLTIAIPALEEMHKDGETGRKKITRITRFSAIGLALVEAIAMAIGFGRSGILENGTVLNGITVVITMAAGTAILMWIGELINQHGIGNGISIVLLINILSSIPADFVSLFELFVSGKTIARGILAALIITAVVLVTVILVVILNDGERNIPVQYSRKVQGRKTVGGQTGNIPLKVNTAGVIPVIFASSLMSLPSMILTFAGVTASGAGAVVIGMLSQNNWFNMNHPEYMAGYILYIAMLVFFAYFYTSITFNPIEVADNMKKSGGVIPGIRSGKPTSDYLNSVLNKLIFIGSVGLLIVVTIPIFFNGVFGASVSFGGTSLIIIVSVILETMQQINAEMASRNYKGFLTGL